MSLSSFTQQQLEYVDASFNKLYTLDGLRVSIMSVIQFETKDL